MAFWRHYADNLARTNQPTGRRLIDVPDATATQPAGTDGWLGPREWGRKQQEDLHDPCLPLLVGHRTDLSIRRQGRPRRQMERGELARVLRRRAVRGHARCLRAGGRVLPAAA